MNDNFKCDVKLYIYMEDLDGDIDYHSKTNVEYDIEFDYRRWGINGVSLDVKKIDDIDYEVISGTDEEEKREEKTVEIDPSKVRIEWMQGQIFAPNDLEVYLTRDGAVREAVLNCYYVIPYGA